MPNYMLLLHDSTTAMGDLSAEDIQNIIGEYVAWSESMAAKEILRGGEKLMDEGGRHLRKQGDEIRVTDGPYAEVKEALGGFFVVEADSYDEATEIAKTCPHMEYGGWIEIRQVDNC
ncbi:MAG: YciI family protein [Pyrinomonadaceae bacterium]